MTSALPRWHAQRSGVPAWNASRASRSAPRSRSSRATAAVDAKWSAVAPSGPVARTRAGSSSRRARTRASSPRPAAAKMSTSAPRAIRCAAISGSPSATWSGAHPCSDPSGGVLRALTSAPCSSSRSAISRFPRSAATTSPVHAALPEGARALAAGEPRPILEQARGPLAVARLRGRDQLLHRGHEPIVPRGALWLHLVAGHLDHPFRERLPQARSRRAETVLDRVHRDLEERGDLGLRLLSEVAERGHDPLGLGQRAHGQAHPSGLLARVQDLARGRLPGGQARGGVERLRRAPAAPEVQAAAGHDLPEPAGEARRVLQGGEPSPREEEGILGGVLGQVEVAEHRVGAPEPEVLEAPHQLAERGLPLGERHVRRRGPGHRLEQIAHHVLVIRTVARAAGCRAATERSARRRGWRRSPPGVWA